MTDFESEQYIEVCRERDVLKARIAELEGKGEKPFNGHTELPWRLKRDTWRDPATDEYESDQLLVSTKDKTIVDIPFGDDEQVSIWDADFVNHAVNSHYPLMAQVRSLRGAAQAAADALGECKRLLDDPHNRSHKDPDFHDLVVDLGSRIGYGAMMTTAEVAWRESLASKGYPVGGEFVVSTCRVLYDQLLMNNNAVLSKLEENGITPTKI